MRFLAKFTSALLWCAIVIAIVFSSTAGIFRITGHEAFIVESGSMEPVIKTGSLAIVDTNDKVPVKGKIMTFELSDGITVTHRIVKSNRSSYVTKGDANNMEDLNEITEDQIIGTCVFSIPGLGYLAAVLLRPVSIGPIRITLLAVWMLGAILALVGLHAAFAYAASEEGEVGRNRR